jgi:hypothetical protein
MSMAMEKSMVMCPQCGQQLMVPTNSMGKQGRCPNCKHIFLLSAAAAAPVAPPPVIPTAVDDRYDEAEPDYNLAPVPEPAGGPAGTFSPMGQAQVPAAAAEKYGHGFGWERRGWDAGMMGGLAMMAIAAVWFFGGLAVGIVFYYPVILFIIGLVGFVRGLFTGNVSGGE